MDIQITTAELKLALSRAQGVADKKGAMPILSAVLLEAGVTPEGGRLTMRAYDLEIGLCSQHVCEVKKDGAVAVPAKALYDIAKALPHSTVRLKSAANNRLEITSGASSFKLAGLSAEDFPVMPQAQGEGYQQVERTAFREALDKVMFAMSSDDTRYNLNGVLAEASPDGVVLAATDGHRLSKFELRNDKLFGLKEGKGAIIPRKAVVELRKLLGEDHSTPAELAFTENTVSYRRQGLTYTARLVDGQFPNYQQVIPPLSEAPAKVAKAALQESLRRVLLVSDGGIVTVELGENTLKLTARTPELGEASDSLAVEAPQSIIKLGLNGTYWLDMLSATSEDTLHLHASGETDPVVLTPATSNAHLYIQMPVRL